MYACLRSITFIQAVRYLGVDAFCTRKNVGLSVLRFVRRHLLC